MSEKTIDVENLNWYVGQIRNQNKQVTEDFFFWLREFSVKLAYKMQCPDAEEASQGAIFKIWKLVCFTQQKFENPYGFFLITMRNHFINTKTRGRREEHNSNEIEKIATTHDGHEIVEIKDILKALFATLTNHEKRYLGLLKGTSQQRNVAKCWLHHHQELCHRSITQKALRLCGATSKEESL